VYNNGSYLENYREYLEVKLISPLIVNKDYYVEFWVSRAEDPFYASNNFGAYFSDTIIDLSLTNNISILNYTPQIIETNVIFDTINWVKVSGCFTATSPAEYMVIGNFYSDSLTTSSIGTTFDTNDTTLVPWRFSYYYYDDFKVLEQDLDDLNAGMDVTICEGDSVSLVAINGVNYLWSNGTQNAINLVFPDSTTIYSVQDSNYCGTFSDEITVFVINLPNPIIQIQNNQLTTGAFSSYQWFLNGILIPNATNQSYIFLENGVYTVSITDNFGCSSLSQSITINNVGLKKIDKTKIIRAYPNPYEKELIVELGNTENSTLKLFNMSGELIFEDLNINTSKYILSHNISSGIYFLEIESSELTMQLKVIKK
jgi:hypothetical protein